MTCEKETGKKGKSRKTKMKKESLKWRGKEQQRGENNLIDRAMNHSHEQ